MARQVASLHRPLGPFLHPTEYTIGGDVLRAWLYQKSIPKDIGEHDMGARILLQHEEVENEAS